MFHLIQTVKQSDDDSCLSIVLRLRNTACFPRCPISFPVQHSRSHHLKRNNVPHNRSEVFCFRLLVPVSCTRCHASTSGLSTPCSAGSLHAPWARRNPYLGEGFPLRCFQRLSHPNVANLPCRWRDNRHTRGSSTQVLSYYGQDSSRFQRAQRIETKLSHDVLNPARVPL